MIIGISGAKGSFSEQAAFEYARQNNLKDMEKKIQDLKFNYTSFLAVIKK